MKAVEQGQVSRSAAEVYEEFYLPALFEQWADRVAAAARVETGQRVLDVACGTGVLARAVATRAGPGLVSGVDVNDGMLAVARRKAPSIAWKRCRAEALPFAAETFDAVVSQFGLMFFQDRAASVAEMTRVLRPGGRLAVAVWDRLDETPGYAALVMLLQRVVGKEAADGLRAPFALGDRERLGALFTDPRLAEVEIGTHDGTARFPSIRSWIRTEVKGWTLEGMIDDEKLEQLLEEGERALHPFVTSDGAVEFRVPAHIVTAVRRRD